MIEILRSESAHDNITFPSFIKLLILASCGGDKTKIGISNYKKLMHHMDIFKWVRNSDLSMLASEPPNTPTKVWLNINKLKRSKKDGSIEFV